VSEGREKTGNVQNKIDIRCDLGKGVLGIKAVKSLRIKKKTKLRGKKFRREEMQDEIEREKTNLGGRGRKGGGNMGGILLCGEEDTEGRN